MKKVILFVIPVIIICIVGAFFMFNNSKENRESNEYVVDFALEVLKGNKTEAEILNDFELSDNLKSYFVNYINENYYFDDDVIVIHEDAELLDLAYNRGKMFSEQAIVDGVFNYDIYNELIYPENFVLESTGEDEEVVFSEIDNKNYELYNSMLLYSPYNKDTNNCFVDMNKLCIKVSDLSFENGEMDIVYKGMKFTIYSEGLEKKIISEIRNSKKYQSIEEISRFEEDDRYFVHFSDYLGNRYILEYTLKHNKINNVILR